MRLGSSPAYACAKASIRPIQWKAVAEALIGRDLEELTALTASLDEPAYRARQIYRGLYREKAGGIESISTLPRKLRETLARDFADGLPTVEKRFDSADGAVRRLLRLADGKSIETVFIPEAARDTLCISTQVGCPVDCKFCLTALMGLERNLTCGEIVGQVLTTARLHALEARGRGLNIVMMGMGEPLLNLDAVMKAARLLTDPQGMAISQRRITVSTSGITPRIEEFARRAGRPKLAISLNASNEEQRARLMPIAKKYPLGELLEVCRKYPLRPWEWLMFEYVLLKGVNDSIRDARAVVRLLANIKCKVNLIPFNPGPGVDFETPGAESVDAFHKTVMASMPCFVRQPRGRDIFAACGQLKRAAQPAEARLSSPTGGER